MIITSSREQLEPRLDASSKLLLLTTRKTLSDGQIQTARRLVNEIDDWNFFLETATRKFSITFAYKALVAHAADLVPAAVLEGMQNTSQRSALATMNVASALVSFHNKCILKAGAKYAYLKGIALSCQFDRPFLDRFSRDIDVLVADEDMSNLVEIARTQGYELLTDATTREVAVERQDIDFVTRYSPVVLLMSPEDVLIEVHRKMGKMSVTFDTKSALERAVDVSFSGLKLKTLPKPLHFVYVCYHHSRHFWSHLHWLSDLDTMVVDADMNRDETLELAASLGIQPSTEAAYEFHELIGSPDSWEKLDLDNSHGGQFLEACLINLDGDLELEYRLREGKTLGEFMSRWQISPGRYFSMWRTSWATRLRPSVAQHLKYRLPHQMHWLYRTENLLILLKNGLRHLSTRLTRLLLSPLYWAGVSRASDRKDDARE